MHYPVTLGRLYQDIEEPNSHLLNRTEFRGDTKTAVVLYSIETIS